MKISTTARIGSLLLALLLLLGSCASKPEETPQGTSAEPAPETTADSGEDADGIDFSALSFIDRVKYANAAVSDNLPENDYGGKTLLVYGVTMPFPDEMNGELVNDAQYAQKLAVEDRFNVEIRYNKSEFTDWDQYVNSVRGFFMAGDHFTDLMINWNTSTAGFVVQGFFEDLSKYEVIDTTKPWYFGDEMELYGYNGHEYVATGMMEATVMMEGVSAVFFNKKIRTDYGLDDFYTVVREGRWTLDYVKSVTADFYYDLNGNTQKDDDDLYGLSYARAASWMVTPATLGIPQISKDDEGNPTLTVVSNAERAETLMDSMKELTESDGARSVSDWGTEQFDSGHALFTAYSLSKLTTMRDGEVDYGILPTWKADEAQEAYYASYLPYPWAIAACAEDKDMCAVLMTAIAAEGFKQVLPAYYENAIKSKYSTDEERGEMLDLMLQNVRSDGMFIYGDSSYIYNLWQYMTSNQGFGSYWKAKAKMLQKTLESTAEKMAALAEMSGD